MGFYTFLICAVCIAAATAAPLPKKSPTCACEGCTCEKCQCASPAECECVGCQKHTQRRVLKGYWWIPDPADGGYWLHKDGVCCGFVVPSQYGWRWHSYEWVEGGQKECPCIYPPGGKFQWSWPVNRAPMQNCSS